jgi:hypothetical protein
MVLPHDSLDGALTMVDGVGAVVDVVTNNPAQLPVCPIMSTVTSSYHTIGMTGTRQAKRHASRPADRARRGQPHVTTRWHLIRSTN